MARTRSVSRIMQFFRAGYPDVAPRTGYVPLLALCGPQASADRAVRARRTT